MQLEGLIFIVLMLVIMPVISLSANHNVFFIVTAAILFIVSLRNIYGLVLNLDMESDTADDELLADLEESINLDMRKFGIGTKVVKNLIAILFFVYSLFYVYGFWLKIMILIIILFWLYNAFHNMLPGNTDVKVKKSLRRIFNIFINISTIFLIAVIAYNKFIKVIF